jgi:hypothetical protein
MDNLDLDNEIKYYEQKLSKVHDEYKNSMIYEWNAIRDKEIYFIRKIYYLNNIKEGRKLENQYVEAPVVIKEQEAKLNKKEEKNNNIEEVVQNNRLDCATNEEVVQSNNIEYIIEEEEQLESSQQFLLESYEEEEDNAQSYIEFINSLSDEELCNLDNAMEGLDIITNNNINSQAEVKIELMDQESYKHDWIKRRGDYNIKCIFCIYYPSQENRFTCSKCLKQACISCLKENNQK